MEVKWMYYIATFFLKIINLFITSGTLISLRAATNESKKTRNKKQNGLAHLQCLVCVTPKQKKHCLIRESSF